MVIVRSDIKCTYRSFASEPDLGTFNSQLMLLSPFALVYSCVLLVTSAARQIPGGPGTRGTDSWLDDMTKILVPNCRWPTV